MIRISDLKIKVENASDTESENKALLDTILNTLKISENEIIEYKIFKKSIDARKKNKIFYVYTIDVSVINEKSILRRCKSKSVSRAAHLPQTVYTQGDKAMSKQPVIIGMGPAGLFAALILSRNGYMPIILERGKDVDKRAADIKAFFYNSVLNTESNIQFGEGGAGTFSDGKLTTLINDRRCHDALEEFVRAGAPRSILYKAKPHLGTDLLKVTVKSMREEIISNGGEVRFNSKVTDFIIKNGAIEAVIVNESERIQCETAILAIGHSARDTFDVLYRRGAVMTPKSFSIGFRIEHRQSLIDKAQYGDMARYPGLGAADYKLSYHSKSGRSAYTFCMCPGGYVVAAASEKECVVTNGMSEYKRDGENANSAVLVGVTPDDFGSSHPLAGIEFQRKWESRAYYAGGESYKAPAQLVEDFLSDRESKSIGTVEPTYRPGIVFADLKSCVPYYVSDTLKEAILNFGTKIKGFDKGDAILTGVETRSSSPVRINRDANFSSNINGIYPIGEGSGYAGGIMSSAVDGIKMAEKIIEKFAPLK